MSALDDKINSLSSDELDLLNSDPKMLADFKAKYAEPPSVTPKLMGMVADQAIQGIGKNIASDIGSNVMGGLSAIKSSLYDVPKAVLSLPAELAQGKGPNETSLGQFTNAGVQGMKDSMPSSPTDALKMVAEHPVSTGMLFSGLGAEEPGIEGAAKGFADTLSENADSKLAKINKALANVNQNATKMGGASMPVPTHEELATGTQNVIKAMKQVVDEHGKILNDAKSKVGLPVSTEEKDFSIRKFGNKRNLNLDEPLAMPEHFSKEAPAMEEPPIRPLEKGDMVEAVGPNGEKVKMKYSMPGMMVGSNDPAFDLKQPVKNPNADWSHPVDSTLSKSTLESYGYKVPDGVPTMEPPKSSPPMPFKISPTKTAEELNTEISRFLKNQDYITKADKIKAASYYQDKISNYVDFTKEGDDMQGLLKSKNNQLRDVIHTASPELQAAKSKWAGLQKNLDLIKDHIDPSEPGKTQSYLKKLFTSNDPATQDKLKQLAYLEKLSGKPVVTDLFKQFAGEAFSPLMSRPGREMLEAAGGIGAAVFGHPVGAASAAGLLAAQSPRFLGAVESGMSKIPGALAKYGPATAAEVGLHRPFDTPDMQSLKDRLKNNAK